ncbi:WD40-repeat-containing domain protein [Apiospora phragmitis]|uniref:WD40-repeat-containing domain protein n=1 Tax=Apiospora phragmitis TaxID=2905665 RepID=A0ABR1TUA0_9PEZI
MAAEQRYWKTFKNQLNIPSPTQYPVTHITSPSTNLSNASASNCDLFAVTTGTRVQLYSIRTRKLVKTITRFGDIARSGDVRRDGRIMVAGDDQGKIQVFDVNSRAILKTWIQHKQPVWTTKFSPADLTSLMSTSDDKTVRLWDLPSQDSTSSFVGHTDYVRSGAFMPGTMSNMIVTGSYDTTVKLWDPRAPRAAVMTFKHASPIEDVLPLTTGTTVLAACESQISVLDLVAAKPLQMISNHQKTVTSLSLASGAKYPSPILAVRVITSGANNDDRHLAVGMQNGQLSIKTRLTGPEAAKTKEREAEMAALIAGNIAQHDKVKTKRKRIGAAQSRLDLLGEGADVVIAGNPATKSRSTKETAWQKDLRRGHFVSALDRVLDTRSKHYAPLSVLTLLVALRHRSALREALEGRDEESVMPVLDWVQKHIVDPRYTIVCTDVATHLLDLYGEYAGESKELGEGFKTLCRRVSKETGTVQLTTEVQGMLEIVLAGV